MINIKSYGSINSRTKYITSEQNEGTKYNLQYMLGFFSHKKIVNDLNVTTINNINTNLYFYYHHSVLKDAYIDNHISICIIEINNTYCYLKKFVCEKGVVLDSRRGQRPLGSDP